MAPGLLGIIRDLAANKGIHLKKKKFTDHRRTSFLVTL